MQDHVSLLTELAACRPVTRDVEKVNQALSLLRASLDGEGLFTAVEELGARRILYASTSDCRTPALLINVHLDVVPAPEPMFAVTEHNGWLHGRGTADCLGNAVAAARALASAEPDTSAGIVFSTDEEGGGATTEAMVARGYCGTELILVMDGPAFALTTAQKGVLTLVLRAAGRACHAAEPWNGENALDRLIDGYLNVRALFPDITPPDEWHNTMVAATIQAGTVANRVPESAEMTLNIRYTDVNAAEHIQRQIADLSGLTVQRRGHCQPVSFPEETPAFKALAECMTLALDRPIERRRMNGATDARHFVGTGVPVAIIGIPGIGAHGPDEAIVLAGLQAYEGMLVQFLGHYRA